MVFLRGDLPAKEGVTIRVYNLMGNWVWQKDLDLKDWVSGQHLVDVSTIEGRY